MKSLEQLFEEIRASEALQKEFAAAAGEKAKMQEFIKKNGCDASIEDAKKFLQEKSETLKQSGELTAEELEAVSGSSEAVIGIGIGVSIFFGGLYAINEAC